MMYVGLGVLFLLALTFAFMAGFNFAMHNKAKDMLNKMYMGTIVFDMRTDADETFQCQFEKSPREMLDKDYILMEVKIRQ